MATVRKRYLVRDQREQAEPAPKLQLGPTMLCDGTQGQIVELLNNGTLAIFRASNGPKSVIAPTPIKISRGNRPVSIPAW